MDFELRSAREKLEREQRERMQRAKAKADRERRAKAEAARRRDALEASNRERRLDAARAQEEVAPALDLTLVSSRIIGDDSCALLQCWILIST
jgi:hypothetical protein